MLRLARVSLGFSLGLEVALERNRELKRGFWGSSGSMRALE